ncbi:S1 family peptidase [Streptomyces candidus]|uniref:S1 family peptidase n=1 Tax=Streptomyces candidus TaxID=67283 RepID=UPI0021AA164D|nr:serine protease [Streptomyces candidus]
MGATGSGGSRDFYADWRLRLRLGDARGRVCGAGILLTRNRVLTCAHVLGDAQQRIWVEFAEGHGVAPVGARLAPEPGSWIPPALHAPESGLDVAVLALEQDRPRLDPALLGRDLPADRRTLRATGYTVHHEAGLTLFATLGGPHGRWVQLDPVNDPVEEGFSGGAVSTVAEDGAPAEVLGMTVAQVGTATAGQERSYMLPVAALAREVPLVDELSTPGAWDVALRQRLRDWFECDLRPPVELCLVPEGGGRDRTLQHALARAQLVHDCATRDRRRLTEQIAAQLPLGHGRLSAFRTWLLYGGEPPPGIAALPGRPVDLAVLGLDRDPAPHRMLPVLARVRHLGLRVLVVVRGDTPRSEETWRRTESDLLAPGLEQHVRCLLAELRETERYAPPHRPRLADRYAAELRGIAPRWADAHTRVGLLATLAERLRAAVREPSAP